MAYNFLIRPAPPLGAPYGWTQRRARLLACPSYCALFNAYVSFNPPGNALPQVQRLVCQISKRVLKMRLLGELLGDLL